METPHYHVLRVRKEETPTLSYMRQLHEEAMALPSEEEFAGRIPEQPALPAFAIPDAASANAS